VGGFEPDEHARGRGADAPTPIVPPQSADFSDTHAGPPVDAAALTGALPCITCKYDLKGLSIRALCPECGTAVRATILWKVDPMADEFRPIHHRRLVASGLVVWSFAALGAAVAIWGLRITDLIAGHSTLGVRAGWLADLAVALAAASALGMIALVRPISGTPLRHQLAALAALAAYVPVLWAMYRIHLGIDRGGPIPYFASEPQPARLALRLIAAGFMVVIILGVRPNARDLVKRSLVMRTGRVDRQTLLIMAVVLAITMVGDALRLAGIGAVPGEISILAVVGSLLVAVGSGFFTLGLGAAAIDSWRIARSVLIPSPSLRQVFGAGGSASSAGPSRR
jgi:hypothetical protein